MATHLNPASGVPLYIQLVEHVKHSIESGVMRVGEQLPSVRQMAEDLMINPNTVARAYRDLEQEGVIELRHGSGAFVRDSIVPRAKLMHKAQTVVESAFDRLESFDLAEDEIRRLIENEFTLRRNRKPLRKKHA
jgi:GntR family transcriptional regulator